MFGKKIFCIQCGLKLEKHTPAKELMQIPRKKELEPIEFEDGMYCKKCAENRMKNARTKKKVEAPKAESYWSF